MANEIWLGILLSGIIVQAISFIYDVPKQLKRIADALKERAIRTNYCPNCGAKMDGDGNG